MRCHIYDIIFPYWEISPHHLYIPIYIYICVTGNREALYMPYLAVWYFPHPYLVGFHYICIRAHPIASSHRIYDTTDTAHHLTYTHIRCSTCINFSPRRQRHPRTTTSHIYSIQKPKRSHASSSAASGAPAITGHPRAFPRALERWRSRSYGITPQFVPIYTEYYVHRIFRVAKI